MDKTQDKRKWDNTMKEEITIEETIIQEVLEEPIEITRLLTQQGNCMHL